MKQENNYKLFTYLERNSVVLNLAIVQLYWRELWFILMSLNGHVTSCEPMYLSMYEQHRIVQVYKKLYTQNKNVKFNRSI